MFSRLKNSEGRCSTIRRLFAAFSRYRPRVLTVLLLAAIASTIVLANSTEEISPRNIDQATFLLQSELRFDLREPIADTNQVNVSYGWPFVWRQYVLAFAVGSGVVGEAYSPGRLAGNAAVWIILLALAAGACEGLLRRWRPRLRFSLRSMLVVVGLAAMLCGWFAVARNRANVQDALIAARESDGSRFWVERFGPKWLELIGADRYRRRIVGAALFASIEDRRAMQQTFDQLTRLPDLEYFSLHVDSLSPEVTDGLGKLRQLRTLRIEVRVLTADAGRSLIGALCNLPRLRVLSIQSDWYQSYEHVSHELPTPGGLLEQVGRLNLGGRTIACEHLACLAGLKNLKSLALRGLYGKRVQIDGDQSLLANLPALTHFESLDLLGSQFGDDDLKHVAALAQLKSLSLLGEDFTDDAFSHLAKLESLEELAIDSDPFTVQSSRTPQVMLRLKRLKKLHIGYFDEGLSLKSPKELRDAASGQLEEVDNDYADWLRGLADLREAKPELAIDGDIDGLDWSEEELAPKCEQIPNSFPIESAREAVRVWKEQQAAPGAIQGAANPPPAAGGIMGD